MPKTISRAAVADPAVTEQALRTNLIVSANTLSFRASAPENIDSAAHEEVGHTLSIASSHRARCQDDQAFERSLIDGVGLDATQARILARVIDSVSGVVKKGAGAIAAVPAGQASTGSLREALDQYMQSPECRRDIMSPVEAKLAAQLDRESALYPFFEYLCSDASTAFRAEALAKISLYVDSGHAANDLAGELPPSDPELSAVLALRDAFESLRSGEPVAQKNLQAIIAHRFSQLFVSIAVDSVPNDVGGPAHLARVKVGAGGQLRATSDNQVAASGEIDVAIRDQKDPGAWHLGFVTSMDSGRNQGDQAARHPEAVRNSIKRAIPPFSKSDSIGSQTFFSSAVMYGNNEDDNQIASKFVAMVSPPLSEAERAQFNALPLLSQLSSLQWPLNAPAEHVIRSKHFVYGAQSAHEGGASHEVPSLVAQAARALADIIEVLATRTDAMKLQSGAEQAIFNEALQAAQGMLTRFAEHKEALGPLIQALPHTEKIAQKFLMAGAPGQKKSWKGLGAAMSDEALQEALDDRAVLSAFEDSREESLDRAAQARKNALPNEAKVEAHIQELITGGLDEAKNANRLRRMRDAGRNAPTVLLDAMIAGHVGVHAYREATTSDGVKLCHASADQCAAWVEKRIAAGIRADPRQGSLFGR